MVPKRNKRSTKRLAILRAAAHVFRERGFAATGMREIAAAADLSAPNLYYYFASKQDLLYYCQDHSLDRMLEESAAAIARATPAKETLRRIIHAHLACMLDEIDGAAAHLEVDALPEPLRSRIVRKRDRYEQGVRAVIARGMRSGAFARRDPALVTRALMGALNWTAHWYRPDGPVAPADLAREFSDYLISGLER